MKFTFATGHALIWLPALVLAFPDLSGAQVTSRDSAGVAIVENGGRRKAAVEFAMTSAPLLEVGGRESRDNEFDHGQGFLRAIRLSNGELVVIDSYRVHFFDARGSRIRIVGREGGGRGEFRYLTSVCRVRGDTIVLSDAHNRRVTVMDRRGALIRELPDGSHGAVPGDGCVTDGFVRERLENARSNRPTTSLARFRLDGTRVWASTEIVIPSPDVMKTKRLSLAASGDLVYVGTGSSSEFQAIGADGRIGSIIRTADTDVPARHPGPGANPAYGPFLADPRGRLWVRDYALQGTHQRWTAFDHNGRMLGALVIPDLGPAARSPEVVAFGDDEVILRRFRIDGTSAIAVFGLRKPPSQAGAK